MREEKHNYRDGDLEIRMETSWTLHGEFLIHHRTYGRKMQTFNIDQLITNVVLPKDGVMLMESYGTDTHSLVEYKLERALLNPRSDYEFQFRVLANLANKAKIPAFACFYRREDYAQYVVPLNEKARRITDYTEKWLTEQQWVWFQHKIRGINVTMDEFMHLNQTKPEDSAA